MNKTEEIHNLKILDIWLETPEGEFDILEIKKRLNSGDQSETIIRKILRKLKEQQILEEKSKPGRPRGGHKGHYLLKSDLETLKRLFELYSLDESKKFLQFNYMNVLIKKFGIVEVFKQFGGTLKDKKMISEAILDHEATIHEYRTYPEKLYKYIEECNSSQVHICDICWFPSEHYLSNPVYLSDIFRLPEVEDKGRQVSLNDIFWFHEIDVLENLDPAIAVPFYRKNAVENLFKLFEKVGGREITRPTEVINEINKLDIYLSPYYSYPKFDPIRLIFAKPFNRLYEDIYILEKQDLKRMAERIYLVYKNFGELLYQYVKRFNSNYLSYFDVSLREYVFLWNSASTYFDKFYMINKWFLDKGSRYYYIYNNNGFMQIRDLVENEICLDSFLTNYPKSPSIESPPLYTGDNWGLKYNPFEALLPCQSLFEEFGFDTSPVFIKEIITELKDKYNLRINQTSNTS